jgi:hypothetical protein
MKIFTFLFINFLVGFISDILLNDLSTNYGIITSLRPYFKNQSIIKCALSAGFTILFALCITIFIYKLLFSKYLPENNYSLFTFCIIGFIVGFSLDIIIQKYKVFGNRLDLYYKEVGAGFWGAFAFIISILISYFIIKNILPKLI